MGIQDKAKLGIFAKTLPKEGSTARSNRSIDEKILGKNAKEGVYHYYGEIESYSSDSLAVLGDTDHFYEDQYPLHKYWLISPSADGTVGSPTLILDFRWRERILFIDISTYAVTMQLPDPTEVAVGFSIKFILNETSEGEATKNFGIITHATGTDIQGYISGGAAMNVTANSSSVYWDTSDAAASGGDWCEVITDGTGWYITGQASLANSVDIADGHDVTT